MSDGISLTLPFQAQESSDEALVAAACAGDREAYTVLVGRHRNLVYGYLYARLRNREEAEDLTQEVFVRAYMALETFRRNSAWMPWMMRIARNLCFDALRSRRGRSWEPLSDDWLDGSPTPESRTLAAERRRQLDEALNALPEKYRTVLMMHYASALKAQEIAVALDLPETTVKGRIESGLRLVRKRLQREDEI